MCDASVLHPSTLHDLLIRVPQSGLVPPKWTEQILDEMVGALKRDRSPVIARPRCEWHVNGTCDLGVIAGAGRRETWSCLTSTRPQGRHSGGSGGAMNAMSACLPVADMAAQVADMSARYMVRRSADRGPSGPHTDEGGPMSTAREIMHTGADCIGENGTLLKAAQMMRDLDVGSLPICGQDDRLKGIITDRDLVVKCLAEGRDPGSLTAGELAQGTIRYVDASAEVDDVVRTMEEHQIRRVPVIENNRLVGIISEADLARHLPESQLAHFVESIYAAR